MDAGFSVQFFIVALTVGLLLIGAEIFVPGGVLGVIGGLLLLAAVVAGFVAFPGYGIIVAFGVLALLAAAMFLWIRYFPSSWMGRRMAVNENLASSKGTQSGLTELLDKQGTASSDLRPGGFALIEGRRVDVITEGKMIKRGTNVRVVKIEGNRVVVRAV